MPDTNFNLLPDEVEDEDSAGDGETTNLTPNPDDTKSADDSAGKEDTESTEGSDMADLQKQIEAMQQSSERQVTDLRTAVGRIQAAVDAVEKTPKSDPELKSTLQTEFATVHDLLGEIIDSSDGAMFDAALRSKITEVRDKARRQADMDSLKEDLGEFIDEKVKDVIPATEQTSTVTQESLERLEADVNAEIESNDLDPGDFDWKEAANIMRSGGETAMRAYFRTEIKSKRAEDDTDSRRQSRKEDAGDGEPNAAGAASSDEERLSSKAVTLDDKIALLRKMGALT